MLAFSFALLIGLVVLVWSADHFITSASCIAKSYNISPLLIGMLIIGFGTSAPELLVSVMASLDDNPGLSLGNAFGSNISNIGLILGTTAVISPILVESSVLKKELPILAVITVGAILLCLDGIISRFDAGILMLAFGVLTSWSIVQGKTSKNDDFGQEVQDELEKIKDSNKKSWFYLFLGLIFLIASSRLLVWGAIGISKNFGISDTIIGLTIVAVGTSLPEFASSIIAAKKNESSMALGNVLGSNLFNTLAVVGASGLINPIPVEQSFIERDLWVMLAFTLSLFIFGFRIKGIGRINRFEGLVLALSFIFYTAILIQGIN